jgi:hypothetical protein
MGKRFSAVPYDNPTLLEMCFQREQHIMSLPPLDRPLVKEIIADTVQIERRRKDRRYNNIRHGHPTAYQRGCRCPDCTRAKRDQARDYRARKKERDAEQTA